MPNPCQFIMGTINLYLVPEKEKFSKDKESPFAVPKKKKNNLTVWAVIFAVFWILLIAGGLIWWFFFYSSSSASGGVELARNINTPKVPDSPNNVPKNPEPAVDEIFELISQPTNISETDTKPEVTDERDNNAPTDKPSHESTNQEVEKVSTIITTVKEPKPEEEVRTYTYFPEPEPEVPHLYLSDDIKTEDVTFLPQTGEEDTATQIIYPAGTSTTPNLP